MVKNLVEGCLIVLLVLILILGDWKAAFLSASVIPLAMLIAVSLMNQFGVLGNLMILGAIDFGMLVDSAIIVVEAVILEMTLMLNEYGANSLDIFEREEAVTNAAIRVKKSVVFGGLIILIVYIPIMTLTSIEGKMFSPMALTVAFAIFGALLLSLTYIPVMCIWFITPHSHQNLLTKFADKLVDSLFKIYEPLLTISLRNKWLVVGISLVFMAIGIFCFKNLGGEFIPKIDEGDYNIEVRLPVGTSLSQSIKISNKISTRLLENFPNEKKNVVCKIGTSEIPTDPASFEVMDIIVNPTSKEKWKSVSTKEELTEKISQFLDEFPGLTYSIMQPIENRFNDMLSGAKTDLVIKVFGDDLDILLNEGNKIANILRSIDGAKDVQVQKIGGLPQISINYNRKRMQHYGISVSKINTILQSTFAGMKAGTIYEGERRFDLSLRLAPEYRSNLEQIKNLSIEDKNGKFVPLKEIAEIKIDKGPAEISRDNGERRINVGCNVRGRDIESLVKELDQKIKNQIKLPKGYHIS